MVWLLAMNVVVLAVTMGILWVRYLLLQDDWKEAVREVEYWEAEARALGWKTKFVDEGPYLEPAEQSGIRPRPGRVLPPGKEMYRPPPVVPEDGPLKAR